MSSLTKIDELNAKIDELLELSQGEITPEIEELYTQIEELGIPIVFSLASQADDEQRRADIRTTKAKDLMALAAKDANRAARIRQSIFYIMERAKVDKLEEGGVVIKIKTNQPSTEIVDASLVPIKYKRFELKVPGKEWETLKAFLSEELANNAKETVSATDVKNAWKESNIKDESKRVPVIGTKIIRKQSVIIEG